jgi:hypothetical protein
VADINASGSWRIDVKPFNRGSGDVDCREWINTGECGRRPLVVSLRDPEKHRAFFKKGILWRLFDRPPRRKHDESEWPFAEVAILTVAPLDNRFRLHLVAAEYSARFPCTQSG